MTSYSVFISRKSSDAKMAKEIYDYLLAQNISAFDSDISLHEIGITEYQSTIDSVLDKASHIIVVGSSIENINSSWVKTEWETFENEKRSGRKKGNLLVVISKKVKIDDLPLALRQKQIFKYEEKHFDKLLPYLGVTSKIETTQIKKPPLIFSNKFFLIIGLIVCLSIYIGFFRTMQKIEPLTQKINADSLFNTTKNQFLNEGLDKNIALENFKKVVNSDISYAVKAKAVFDEKAQKTPYLKEKYLKLSEKIILYADSVNKAK